VSENQLSLQIKEADGRKFTMFARAVSERLPLGV